MVKNKTQPTNDSVQDFIDQQPEPRRQDSITLVEMMRQVSGQEPALWGSSIIGFGKHHYKYETGREGDMPLIGFSPRKSNMTIYISDGFDDYANLLGKLGKHKTSVSCLYIDQLAHVDKSVLRSIIEKSHRAMSGHLIDRH